MNRYYGFYRGTVVQQLTNGFCKITIPGILYFTNEDAEVDQSCIDKLPPAECAAECFGGTITNGTFKYPDLYSTVWCFFEDGNVNKPVYFATANSSSTGWTSSDVAIVPNQRTIPGYTLAPVTTTGKISKVDQSTITQTTTIDPQTNTPINSTIKLTVDYTPEGAEAVSKKVDVKKDGAPRPTAAGITISNDNKGKIIISAADTIEFRAPNIRFNGSDMGSPGVVTINTDDVVINTTKQTTLKNSSFSNDSSNNVLLRSKTDIIART